MPSSPAFKSQVSVPARRGIRDRRWFERLEDRTVANDSLGLVATALFAFSENEFSNLLIAPLDGGGADAVVCFSEPGSSGQSSERGSISAASAPEPASNASRDLRPGRSLDASPGNALVADHSNVQGQGILADQISGLPSPWEELQASPSHVPMATAGTTSLPERTATHPGRQQPPQQGGSSSRSPLPDGSAPSGAPVSAGKPGIDARDGGGGVIINAVAPVVPPFVDLDIDSDNNNGYFEPDRSPEEELIEEGPPGKYIVVNDEDIDADGVIDFADGFNRDDIPLNADDLAASKFVPIVLYVPGEWVQAGATVRFEYDASNPPGSYADGTYTPAAGHLRIWKPDGNVARNKAKANAAPAGDYVAAETHTALQLGLTPEINTVTFFVEGIRTSTVLGADMISVYVDPDGGGPLGEGLGDVVATSVVNVDLDVDSDNSDLLQTPDRTQPEDVIENHPDTENAHIPGVYVEANVNDCDDDLIPDFADGYNLDGAPNADNTTMFRWFTKMVLDVPTPVDLTLATISLLYDGSNPNQVAFVDGLYTPDENRHVRVWKRDGNNPERTLSDYIDPWTTFSASYFGLSNNSRTVTLYIEGIIPSAGPGQETFLVSVDPDGTGPAVVQDLVDQVRASVIGVDLDIDSDNDDGYSVPPLGTLREDQMEAHPGLLGKLIDANLRDREPDGVPDFADGYNLDPANPADNQSTSQFVSLELKLSPAINLDTALNGSCGAWTDFFIKTLKVQGIDNPDEEVELTYAPAPHNGYFSGILVKNWGLQNGGSPLPSPFPEFPYVNIAAEPSHNQSAYTFAYADVVDVNGIPGQGPTANPKSLFTNHAVVYIGTRTDPITYKFYDPSYGVTYDVAAGTGDEILANIDSVAIAGYFNAHTLPLKEADLGLDLNSNGNMTDVNVETTVFFIQENPPGNQLHMIRHDK